MNRRLALAALVAFTAPVAALGQHSRDVVQDRGEVADDVRDLRRVEILRDRWFRARDRRDDRALDRIEENVSRVLEAEQREPRAEMERDAEDARRAAAKAREARRDAREGDASARREAREQAMTAQRERSNTFRDRAVFDRLANLDREFSSLRGRRDPRSMDGKARVLNQLVELARAELRHDDANRRMDEGKTRRDERDPYRDRR